MSPGRPLARFAWLSVGAAVATLALKTVAYRLTGSVGLLSDALESLVNLAAALLTVAMVSLASRPPDDEHAFGYGKAEYFSSGAEGALIRRGGRDRLGGDPPVPRAATARERRAGRRRVDRGLAREPRRRPVLLRAGRRHHSIALEADAYHLMTDVWTSAGVVVAVVAVALTGWQLLDPLIALAVAAQIVWSGAKLVRRSLLGLLDPALAEQELAAVRRVLGRHSSADVQFHAVRTRQAGARRFVSMHVLVPGAWTVRRGHALCEALEVEVARGSPTPRCSPPRGGGGSSSFRTRIDRAPDARLISPRGLGADRQGGTQRLA
jgi:divalent metal cation (Fe/Co/Zn/Cd) transporter